MRWDAKLFTSTVKVKGGTDFHVKDKFWSPTIVLYIDPILPVSYCSLTTSMIQEYMVYVKFDVNVYTRWKLYGNGSHVDGVLGIDDYLDLAHTPSVRA